MSHQNTPEKSPWGWKALIIFCVIGGLFMFIFWLAVSNEPDYMPSQQTKKKQQAALQQSSQPASEPTAAEMGMTEEEHANMDNTHAESNTAHGHSSH